ncbi:hypothetical protein D3C71_1656490 [compost metagenome]
MRSQRHIAGVNANGVEVVLLRFFTEFGDLLFGGIHRQQGVVDIAGVINVFSRHFDSLLRFDQSTM